MNCTSSTTDHWCNYCRVDWREIGSGTTVARSVDRTCSDSVEHHCRVRDHQRCCPDMLVSSSRRSLRLSPLIRSAMCWRGRTNRFCTDDGDCHRTGTFSRLEQWTAGVSRISNGSFDESNVLVRMNSEWMRACLLLSMVHLTETFGEWIVIDFQLCYLEKTMAVLNYPEMRRNLPDHSDMP